MDFILLIAGFVGVLVLCGVLLVFFIVLTAIVPYVAVIMGDYWHRYVYRNLRRKK